MKVFWFLVIVGAIYVVYRIARSNKHGDNNVKTKQNTSCPGTNNKADEIGLQYKVSVREKITSEERTTELLKEATQRKANKDLDGAISCLRKAYNLTARSNISYPIEIYLRLPVYLQQARCYTESIAEFEKLLCNSPARIAKEFSHISKQEQKGLAAMQCSAIYNKMRLVSQREKQFSSAVCYQILSDANRAVGLKLQKREKELDIFKSRDFWTGKIEPLLKKAKKEALAEELLDRSVAFSRKCTLVALNLLSKEIEDILDIGRKAVV